MLLTFALFGLFLMGLCWYWLTGSTPNRAYRAMRDLHARTDGKFNDACLRLLRAVRPNGPVGRVSGCLGEFTAQEIQRIASAVEADGIAMFEQRLPDAVCDRLIAFARATPARPMGGADKEVYRTETARALRYDFDQRDILGQADAARIALDGTFAAIAGAYFGCRPVYDFTTMWWTTGRGVKDYSQAAQEFHYDMDRLFFLKFFVYLTDVTERTGPHVFVAGSHRRKPAQLRRDGRYADEEIQGAYPAEQILKVCGRRGTMFAADTRAFHKGLPIVEGERLVLQVEFAVSRFGQNYPDHRMAWSELQGLGLAQRPDPRVFGSLILP